MPQSNLVDYRSFSRLLDDDKVVARYKMYWLLGILDEVALGNTEIEFKRIIARMIVYSWYPLLQYKLNYGIFYNKSTLLLLYNSFVNNLSILHLK